MRTLVIDTATAACSVALIEGRAVLAATHEVVNRGHAERLLPMIAALPDGGRADHILVDVGPGSFTGIRVGVAAARALALGWEATIAGYSSLALIAVAFARRGHADPFAVMIEGGHGEVFMQDFASHPAPVAPSDMLVSLTPADALARLERRTAVGSGVRRLLDLPATQDGGEWLPDAREAMHLPDMLRQLPPSPLYGRAPDAKLPTPR